MIECICCGKSNNCAFTTVNDARLEVGELWFCRDCFNKYFYGDYKTFEIDPNYGYVVKGHLKDQELFQKTLPLTFS